MFRKITNIALLEYKQFFSIKKIIIILFSFIFLYEDVVHKMVDLSKELGYEINKLEPFDLLMSYNIHAMVVPLTFVFLIQGFPNKTSFSYYHISKMTRTEWMIGETIYSVMVAISYILAFFLSTIVGLIGTGSFGENWSPYMKQLYYDYPDKYYGNNQLFIKTSTISQGKPIFICIFSMVLMVMYMIIIAQLLMLFKLHNMKKVGVILTLILIVFSSATVELSGNIKWYFPMAHAMYGTHYNGFNREAECSIYKSFIYFGIVLTALLIINYISMKKTDIGESEI